VEKGGNVIILNSRYVYRRWCVPFSVLDESDRSRWPGSLAQPSNYKYSYRNFKI
jgi:hypothetical protein